MLHMIDTHHASHSQSKPCLLTKSLKSQQPNSFAGPVSAKKHAIKLPFSAPIPPPPAAGTEEEEDIEVDLGLQQALTHSMVPSPAKIHSKGNALHDISNWRLPTPGKKEGPGGGVSPLQALTGTKGGRHRLYAGMSPVLL